MAKAKALADGYDYDGAIELLRSDAAYADDLVIKEAIAAYEETKSTLVRIDPTEVTHVFFHTLI
ncbi:MAG: polysaccharide deacetylase, partial [Lachnospiraceae bacterium]|nr:polysaccharide deacetylase [Lachnospiraceae bacterium]